MSFIIEVPYETIYNAGNDLQVSFDFHNSRYILDCISKKYNAPIEIISVKAPDGRGYISGYSIKFNSEADAIMFLLRFS